MSTLSTTLAKIEPDLLAELIEAAQLALNDVRSAKSVAQELGVPVARVHALAHLAIQLSVEPDHLPDVSTKADLDAFQAQLAEMAQATN